MRRFTNGSGAGISAEIVLSGPAAVDGNRRSVDELGLIPVQVQNEIADLVDFGGWRCHCPE